MGRVVWVSRCHAPRVSFGAWGGLVRVAACLRYACERFACARFSFVLFGRAPLAAWVYDGGVPRGAGFPLGWNVTLRVRDGGGNVVEASSVWDVLRGLPDVTSVERDEVRIMVEGSWA